MKITTEHLSYMQNAIVTGPAIPAWDEYKRKGLSHARWRWDVAHNAGLTGWFSSTIYGYADDSHIDTALRLILGRE